MIAGSFETKVNGTPVIYCCPLLPIKAIGKKRVFFHFYQCQSADKKRFTFQSLHSYCGSCLFYLNYHLITATLNASHPSQVLKSHTN